jgi:hypothetical protein
VYVQVKLTVVAERLQERSRRSASTQTPRVTLVDFRSNHPFHVKVERVTRSLWASAADAVQGEAGLTLLLAADAGQEVLSRQPAHVALPRTVKMGALDHRNITAPCRDSKGMSALDRQHPGVVGADVAGLASGAAQV